MDNRIFTKRSLKNKNIGKTSVYFYKLFRKMTLKIIARIGFCLHAAPQIYNNELNVHLFIRP
jgi:hypothetical protein